MIKLFRKLFGEKTPENMTHEELDASFLEGAAKLARKGNATIYIASHMALNDVLTNPNHLAYIVVLKYPKKRGSRDLINWFKNYRIGDLQ